MRLQTNFNFKRLYKNGSLRICGIGNVYAIWNEWMYQLYVRFTRKKPAGPHPAARRGRGVPEPSVSSHAKPL
jgi:hypothetical protein